MELTEFVFPLKDPSTLFLRSSTSLSSHVSTHGGEQKTKVNVMERSNGLLLDRGGLGSGSTVPGETVFDSCDSTPVVSKRVFE